MTYLALWDYQSSDGCRYPVGTHVCYDDPEGAKFYGRVVETDDDSVWRYHRVDFGPGGTFWVQENLLTLMLPMRQYRRESRDG